LENPVRRSLRRHEPDLEAAIMKQHMIAMDTSQRTINRIYSTLIAVVLSAAGSGGTAMAVGDDYSQNALLNPSESILLAEHRGRVTIFDGLDERVVDRALDTQFERIDRMMFVRTRYVQQDGSFEFDDDCD
jgi:hypothetical protein